MRARRPLNQQAVQEANERLWEDNPELDGRRLTMGSEDYEYRRQWMAAYQESLARQQTPPASSGGDGQVGDPSPPCPGATTADLGVRVTRTNDGQPVEGATVEISGPDSRNGTTDASGSVLFRGVNPGQYTVTGSKRNYTTETATATASAGATATAALSLTADVELGVTVTDRSDSSPIDGAMVRITGPEMHEARTDSSGMARFVGIATGEYQIRATHAHYRAGDASVTVDLGSTQASMQLTATGGLGGVVRDADSGSPVEGATVSLQERAGVSVTSDATGRFNFPDIDAGTYHILARKAGYVDGTATATVDAAQTGAAEVQLRRIALEITDAAGTVLTGTQTRIVGQKVQLRVRTRPAGQGLTNIQWTLQEERIASYTQTGNAGTITRLTPADLQRANVDFYWISGGNKRVQVRAVVAGATLSAEVDFDVLRPTVNHFTITVSSVNVTNAHFAYGGQPVLTAYQPAPPPARFGSQWDAEVTAPAGGNGEIGFTQRIRVNRTRAPNAGADQHFSSGGDFILDGDLGIRYSGPRPIAAGASATLNGAAYADSPATPLTADLRAKSVDEAFELYLMYKPAGADSIWITLGMGTWGWVGRTTRVGAPHGPGNVWDPAAGTNMPSANGVDSTTLPTWTRQFSSITWV